MDTSEKPNKTELMDDVNTIYITNRLTVAETAHLASTQGGRAQLKKAMRAALEIDAAAARALLRSQADDVNAHPKIRQDAAKALLAMAGYVAPKASAQDKAPASLADMTSEQLRAILAESEKELAARSAPVNAQPAGPDDANPLELL